MQDRKSVVLFESGGAADYMDAVRVSCAMRGRANAEEGAEHFIDLPRHGDELVAIQFEEFDQVNYMALLRRGDAVVTLHYASDEPSLAILESVVRAADERLRKVERTLNAPDDPDYYIPPTPQPSTLDEILASALFTLEDLEPGWVQTSRIHVDDREAICDDPPPHNERPEPMREEVASFHTGRASISQVVWLYPPGDAPRRMEFLRSDIESEPDCTATYGYDLDDGNGEQQLIYNVEIRPLDLEFEGEHLFAFRVSYELRNGNRHDVSDYVYLQRGDVIMAAAFHHPTAPPSALRNVPPTEQIEKLGMLLDQESIQLENALREFAGGN